MINELDGLAKGPEMEHRAAGYARQVQERARKSIEFLEERFESRDNCLRALTSRGNELESISFRSEDTTGQQVRGHRDPKGMGTPRPCCQRTLQGSGGFLSSSGGNQGTPSLGSACSEQPEGSPLPLQAVLGLGAALRHHLQGGVERGVVGLQGFFSCPG